MAPKNRSVPPTPSTPYHTVPATPSTPASSSAKPSGASSSTTLTSQSSAQDIVEKLWSNYVEKTPQRTKLIDVFMAFLVAVGVVQFVYCVLAGNYPFNAFLSGFCATVGQFVLTASLRMQSNPENKDEFKRSQERAFADFVLSSLLLHFFCVNFIN